jgi:MOSC domain-containing protein YiiM
MRSMLESVVMVEVAETRDGVQPSTVATGRVVQVATSPGGVPKLPVASARVNRLGLEGDLHNDLVDHGGPMRAVSLLAIEAIRRVAAEGNPIAPGTTGENVTTEGIELGALPYGTRLAIGPDLVIELTFPANPCKNIAHNFSDGRFARLSPKVHPLDTRVYASVVREGVITPGDEIRVIEAPAPDA